jgi:Protein of unknown function (DUF1499)
LRFLAFVSRLSLAALIAAVGIGLLAAFGTRFGLWNWHFGLLRLFPWCLYVGALGLAAGLVWGAVAFFTNTGTGARYGAIGLIGSVILVAPLAYDKAYSESDPPIHDISTDTEHAPQFVALLSERAGATNSPDYDGAKKVFFKGEWQTVSSLQHEYYGYVRPVAILQPPERLFKRAVAAAYGMGWNIVSIVPDAGRIEATDTSFFFGFTDDIVIRVRPAGMGARLDIRSESRALLNDRGENAARIRAFAKLLASSG